MFGGMANSHDSDQTVPFRQQEIQTCSSLIFSMLGKNFSRRHFEIFFARELVKLKKTCM